MTDSFNIAADVAVIKRQESILFKYFLESINGAS